MMADEYTQRYGKEFFCFPNPVRIQPLQKTISKSSIPNVVFTGKIGWHNGVAIKEMMVAVERINSTGQEIRFDIYTDTPKSQIEYFVGKIPAFTVVHEPVPNSEVPAILATAHILYLPISTDKQTAKFTKYSMSTKMGEYLSAGVPTIYCGPKGIAMTEFLKQKKCAIVISECTADLLVPAVCNCIGGDNQEMLARGMDIAHNYFNIDYVADKFAKNIGKL